MKLDRGTKEAIEALPPGVIALRFKDVHEELLAFRRVVEPRLEGDATMIFSKLKSDLEQIARATGRETWKTRREIRTLSSDGGHQRGRCGHGRTLYGTIDFRWDIEPLSRVLKRQALNRCFALRNSSVRIKLIDSADEEVARWDFDAGDDRSPGCHFHAKFAEADEGRRERFRDIDVPRLPTVIFMPTDATEFVLGELWQDEWREFSMSSSKEVNEWRRYPQGRLCKILEWHLEILRNERAGTPWAQLKSAKPEPSLFLDA
ncbi:MAG: hypothetical protein M3O15_01760 [Acidobacteriota bacterium]|nr:hypothetical protein [Acidobacteriota bacterium]